MSTLWARPALATAFAGEFLLLLRQRDAGDLAAIGAGGEFGEAAPAAADLQHLVAGLQLQAVRHAAIFRRLGLGERRLPDR
jgi:hypothetical protein